MIMVNGQRVRFENLRSLGFAAISGAYAAVGAAFANPVRTLKITNLTDADIMVSFDALSDKDIIPANGWQIYDYGSNAILPVGNLEQFAGEVVYVKSVGAVATVKSVYVTVIYAAIN